MKKRARPAEARAKRGDGGRPSRVAARHAGRIPAKPHTTRAEAVAPRAAAKHLAATKTKPKGKSKSKSKDGLARVHGEFSPSTEWQDLMAMADLDGVRVYSMGKCYSRGEVIQHKAFGIGIVVQQVGDSKIQVSFRDGTRLLVCNWHK